MLQHDLPCKHDNFDYNMVTLNVTLIYLDAQYIDLKFYSIYELSFDELKQEFNIIEKHNKKTCFKMALLGECSSQHALCSI